MVLVTMSATEEKKEMEEEAQNRSLYRKLFLRRSTNRIVVRNWPPCVARRVHREERSDDSISSDGSDEENDDEGEEGKESTVGKKEKKKKNQRMFIPDEFVEEDVNVLSAFDEAGVQRLQAIEKPR